MPIKLLPKQEITRLQAEEKRVAVAEGMKLARRVDNLREVAAQEEASLASFRSATLKAIKSETDVAKKERDTVLQEVKVLREELQEGTQVLDEREKALIERENLVKDRETELEKRIFALNTLTEKVRKEEKEAQHATSKLKNIWDILVKMGDDIKSVYGEAQSYLEGAIDKATQIALLFQEVDKELKHRDIEVASRERDVIIKEERVQRTFKELHEREVQLRDRELTLEREIKRVKKYGT